MPRRMSTPSPRLDLAQVMKLEFSEPDLVRFPALRMAREASERCAQLEGQLAAAHAQLAEAKHAAARRGAAKAAAAQGLAQLGRRGVQHGRGGGLGQAGQPVQALRGVGQGVRGQIPIGHAQAGAQGVGQAPLGGHRVGQLVQAHTQHLLRGLQLAQARCGAAHEIAHLLGIFGQVKGNEQPAHAAKQRAHEGFLGLGRRGAQLAGQGAGHDGVQEGLLELQRMDLVVHVVEQHQRQREVAHPGHTDEADRPRDGANGVGAGAAVVCRVDHAQQLLRQGHVLKDLVAQGLQAVAVGLGQGLHAADGRRQGREVLLAAHAAQEVVQRQAGLGLATADGLRFGGWQVRIVWRGLWR